VFVSVLIEGAEKEFNEMIEEELQRRIKEQEDQEQITQNSKKLYRSRKHQDGSVDESSNETDSEDRQETTQNGIHSNGTSNGNHQANGHNENGNALKSET
jgi:hypothetical protein